jgi:DNA-binding winged helix-turn-helix (wHTH) protein
VLDRSRTRLSVRFGPWVLDRGRHELLGDGRPVALTGKAYQLLDLLLERRPRMVTKAEIHDRLWPSTFVADVNLSRLVFELRAALADDARSPLWIRTVRGLGYAFGGAAAAVSGLTTDGNGACRLLLPDRDIVLPEAESILGRGSGATVWLDSIAASRRHARIVIGGARATLEDLGSRNGTFRNGERVRFMTALEDRDRIRVGSIEITFRGPLAEVTTDSGDDGAEPRST